MPLPTIRSSFVPEPYFAPVAYIYILCVCVCVRVSLTIGRCLIAPN